MAVTHSTAARNAATNAVVDLIDAAGQGLLVFRAAPSTVGSVGAELATLTFAATAFGASGASVAGRADAAAITSDTSATGGGAVAYATLETGASTVVVHCEVAASASDINMTGGLTIGAGDTVACSQLYYTALSA
jgi:hypothetical protein